MRCYTTAPTFFEQGKRERQQCCETCYYHHPSVIMYLHLCPSLHPFPCVAFRGLSHVLRALPCLHLAATRNCARPLYVTIDRPSCNLQLQEALTMPYPFAHNYQKPRTFFQLWALPYWFLNAVIMKTFSNFISQTSEWSTLSISWHRVSASSSSTFYATFMRVCDRRPSRPPV